MDTQNSISYFTVLPVQWMGGSPRDKYPSTCAVTENVCEPIFDAKEEKARKGEIINKLEAMDNFDVGIRSRIDEYTAWAKEMHGFCAEEKKTKPQIAGLIAETEIMLERFDEVWKRLNLKENNPPAAKNLSQDIIALIDGNGQDKDEKVKELGRAIRTIGGSQDRSIGEFRMITKEIRQRSGYAMMEAKDELSFAFEKEIHDRTMKMLYCAFKHEGPATN